jgi:hypothetical protein
MLEEASQVRQKAVAALARSIGTVAAGVRRSGSLPGPDLSAEVSHLSRARRRISLVGVQRVTPPNAFVRWEVEEGDVDRQGIDFRAFRADSFEIRYLPRVMS